MQLPREQWQAVELDLLNVGKGFTIADLCDGTLSWRVFYAMVHHSPRGSALLRVMFAEQVEWSPTEYLLADAVDVLNIIAWLQSDTQKNKRPEPVRRPGVEPEKPTMTFGNKESAVRVGDFWAVWDGEAQEPS